MDKFKIALVLHASDNPQLSVRTLGQAAASLVDGVSRLLEGGVNRLNLYLPGPLWEAAVRERPRELASWREKHRDGLLEFLGGGYYDPVFPLLPEILRKLQIQKLNDWLLKYLQVRPNGFWLSAFLWENSLVETIRGAGFEFVVLKDYQLEQGVSRAQPSAGYWTQEDRGSVVGILPAQSILSDNLRKGELSAFLKGLQSHSPEESLVVDLPLLREGGILELEKDLEGILEMHSRLRGQGVEIQYKCLSNMAEQYRPQGALNLASAVGRNLGLPPHLVSCRDLLVLQPECNYIHKKMLFLHTRARRHLDEKKALEVDECLLPTHSVYWFRIYENIRGIPCLRDRARCHALLLQAQVRFESLSTDLASLQVEVLDFLANADKQILGSNAVMDFLLDHRNGGQLRSLEYKTGAVNLVNGFRRSKPHPEDIRIYQVQPVTALKDFLLPPGEENVPMGIEACWENVISLQNPYDYQIRRAGDRLQVLLAGEQSGIVGNKQHSFRMEKVLSFRAGVPELLVSWRVVNATFQAFRGGIGSEWNFSFLDWDEQKQFVRVDGRRVSLAGLPVHMHEVYLVEFCDRSSGVRLRMDFPKPCRLLLDVRYQQENENAVQEKFVQSLRMATIWETDLMGQDAFSFQVRLRFRSSKSWLK